MGLTRKRNDLSILLLILSILVIQTSRVTGETYTANGHKIQTRLVPDKTDVMLGEPIYVSFIVDNYSNEDLRVLVGSDYRDNLGRPESFTVSVLGEDKQRVPQPKVEVNMGGIVGPKRIPTTGNYMFRLFLPHWTTFQKVGNYTMVASRTLALSKHTEGEWDSREKKTDVKVQASTEIQVVPLDKVKMGKVIERFGNAMFNKDYDESREARRALEYIQDERVIPYFIKALETNSYDLKFSALRALSKFDNESAFLALQKGLATKAEDIDKVTTEKLANQLAYNVRSVAAHALADSPHPEAIPYLLSRRGDASEGVRMTILHVLGEMTPKQAIPILQAMTHDKSKSIRDEAKRYLKLLSSKE